MACYIMCALLKDMKMNAYEKLEHIYGSGVKISKAFKVSRQAVDHWRSHGIPATRAKQVEEVTEGQITIIDVINSERK